MANDVSATLRRALGQLSAQKQKIDQQISAIQTALGALGHRSAAAGGGRGGGRRSMSPAARRAVGRRMRAYWAKRKAEAARNKAKATK
jgi:hypothetical protein